MVARLRWVKAAREVPLGNTSGTGHWCFRWRRALVGRVTRISQFITRVVSDVRQRYSTRFAILLPTGDATERPERRRFMEHVNNAIFLSINAEAYPSRFLLLASLFLGYWLVLLVILLFVLLWIRKPDYNDRAALISATITMMLGLAINQFICLVYVPPRPFMVGLGHQYLSHRPDNSFPSDHATVLWSLAFAPLMLGAQCAWAVLLGVAGAAVAWARVYDGVHFRFEMGGSLLVALVAMSFTFAIYRLARPWLMPSCIGLYENGIRLCRLPPLLFPRRPASMLLRQRDVNQNLRSCLSLNFGDSGLRYGSMCGALGIIDLPPWLSDLYCRDCDLGKLI